jgi:hypothetical protein
MRLAPVIVRRKGMWRQRATWIAAATFALITSAGCQEEAAVVAPPTADAGIDRTVIVGTEVALDGTASDTDDGLGADALEFHWSVAAKPNASASTLSDEKAQRPTVLIDAVGEYTFHLVVSIGGIDSRPDAMTIRGVPLDPLRVVEWSPASGSACVETDVAIHTTFSGDVEADSLTAESLYLVDSSARVETTLSYDEQSHTAQLTPTAPLDDGRVYAVVATTEIRSAEKGGLLEEQAASFQTAPRTGCAPDVECSLPSDCDGKCPGSDACICSNIGVCGPECLTDVDCFRGTCTRGACIPDP